MGGKGRDIKEILEGRGGGYPFLVEGESRNGVNFTVK
jgi:hypothetical protein